MNTNPDQTNTRPAGPFAVLAGESLVGKRSYIGVLTHDAGVPEVKLPTSINQVPLYLINEEGADAALVAIEPLAEGGPARRAVLKGACNPGDVLVLAAIAGADAGKIRALPADAGVYVQLGVAEEVGVDTQHLLFRPTLKLIVVPTVVAAPGAATSTNGAAALAIPGALTSADGIAAAAAADLAALAAEAEKIGDDVRAVHAAMLLAQAETEKIGDDARAALAKIAAIHTALVANGQLVIA